jgi:phage shock protein A
MPDKELIDNWVAEIQSLHTQLKRFRAMLNQMEDHMQKLKVAVSGERKIESFRDAPPDEMGFDWKREEWG